MFAGSASHLPRLCSHCDYSMDVLYSLGNERGEGFKLRCVFSLSPASTLSNLAMYANSWIIRMNAVVKTLNFNLRSSPAVKEALGEGCKPRPFLLGTDPWVHGTVGSFSTMPMSQSLWIVLTACLSCVLVAQYHSRNRRYLLQSRSDQRA